MNEFVLKGDYEFKLGFCCYCSKFNEAILVIASNCIKMYITIYIITLRDETKTPIHVYQTLYQFIQIDLNLYKFIEPIS